MPLKTLSFLAFHKAHNSAAMPTCQTWVATAGGEGRLQIEKLAAGMETPIASQTLAASVQSKKMCRPVSSAEQAEQQAEGAQFLKNKLARVLSRSISAR
jgi:hypothetical protein